jgi:hypothetical protein
MGIFFIGKLTNSDNRQNRQKSPGGIEMAFVGFDGGADGYASRQKTYPFGSPSKPSKVTKVVLGWLLTVLTEGGWYAFHRKTYPFR